MRLLFQKLPGGALVPLGPDAERYLAQLPAGGGIELDVHPVTDMRLHRKFFKLVELGFQHWEPNEDLRVDGMSLREDLKSYRKKLLILAGHYEATYLRDGSVKLEARSISVAKCDGVTFARVYKACMAVIWDRVLKYARYESPAEVERVVNEMLSYG